jgi:hypothetical protein
VGGDLTIRFYELAEGTHSDCKIFVKDAAQNEASLKVSAFKIDITAPSILNESPKAATDSLNPVIKADFADKSIIDVSGVNVSVTGGAITFNNDYFTITPAGIISNTGGIYLATATTYTVVISGLKDSLNNATPTKTWTFTVNSTAGSKDTEAPTVSAVTPADGASGIVINTDPTITFSEAMDKNTLTTENIQLRKYSDDTVVSAAVKVSDDATKVTIDPTSLLSKGTQYYVTISALVKDTSGNAINPAWTEADKAAHEFTTTDNTAVITLKQGWNMISLPLIPNDSSIDEVLKGTANAAANVNIVQYYDTDRNDWLTYKPSAASGNTLTTMEDGRAYWIFMNVPGTLTISGKTNSISPRMYTVAGQKWNMIGFKSTTNRMVKDYLPVSQMSSDDRLVVFEYAQDGDFYYDELENTDYMEPGLGYWIFSHNKEGFKIATK